MTPNELDKQSPIIIDKWVDIDSSECKDLDDNPSFTKKIICLGFQEPAFLFTDSKGRVWGKPKHDGEQYFPLHMEIGKKKIGYRISKKAAN